MAEYSVDTMPPVSITYVALMSVIFHLIALTVATGHRIVCARVVARS